jgi:hypothetical protein
MKFSDYFNRNELHSLDGLLVKISKGLEFDNTELISAEYLKRRVRAILKAYAEGKENK